MDKESQSEPLLVSIPDAAALLAVSTRTIYRLIKSGDLAVVKLTRDTPRLKMAEIRALAGGYPQAPFDDAR